MPTEELFGAYMFVLEIDGATVGYFQAIEAKPPPPGSTPPAAQTRTSPLSHKVSPVSHKISPLAHKVNPATAKKIPGRLKWSDITLKRGVTASPGSAAPVPGRIKWDAGATEPTGAKNWGDPHLDVKQKAQWGRSSLNAMAVKRQPVGLVLKGFKPSAKNAIAFPDVCKSGRILLKDAQGATVAKWTFSEAWPSKVTTPHTRSDNDVAIEELVIVAERISLD